ncbi:MAG: DciA family protein, partial [Candidatus Helarchaeales archaeon]
KKVVAMSEIKAIVNTIIHDLEQKKERKTKDVHAVWKSCVKEKEALHTWVQETKGNMLYVNVDCSAWMFQCRLRYKVILQNIQKEYPEIKRIYFKVGKIT